MILYDSDGVWMIPNDLCIITTKKLWMIIDNFLIMKSGPILLLPAY